MTQAAAMGALFVRALPVVLLTVVVFLNPYAWLLASTLTGTRLATALLFLFAVTTAFIVSSSRSRVGLMLDSVRAPHAAPMISVAHRSPGCRTRWLLSH